MSAATARQSTQQREFAFTQADFDRVRKLIYDYAGINLTTAKFDMVYSRLARRLRALGETSFSRYLDRLDARDSTEWQTFVNALTTNLTSFFREGHHFEHLARHLAGVRGRRPVRIWCSAASTGEEPYSIAITVMEALGAGAAEIIASDVDTNVLEHGRNGVYALDRVDQLSQERLRRFFFKGAGAQAGYVKVRPELQAMITWKQINLLSPNWPVAQELDVIFCRNVMIYFDKPTQNRVLGRMVPLLRDDGLFYAGHSESFVHASHLMRPLGRTVYARVTGP